MPVPTRPYFLMFNGNPYMVEATGPAGAVRHVVGAAVTELRVARGSEVAAWHREGKQIPIAGAKTAAPDAIGDIKVSEIKSIQMPGGAVAPSDTTAVAVNDAVVAAEEPVFEVGDAARWLVDHGMTDVGLATWNEILRESRMTLAQFDALRTDVADFGVAIVIAIHDIPESTPIVTAQVDDVRSALEDLPFGLEVVIGAIAEAKRRELFEPDTSPSVTGDSAD